MYVGVTHDLLQRVQSHKDGLVPGFTVKHQVNKLVYFEVTDYFYAARTREKQLKGWSRAKKDALVGSMNPTREDLYSRLSC